MRRSLAHAVAFALSLAAPTLVARTASAGAEACGNIHVEASAKCEVAVDCKAQCQPVSFVAACEGKCTGSASASCTGGCEAECKGSCEVDPGKFDCYASCEGSCGAECDGYCKTKPNGGECAGQCKASCEGRCEGKCEVVPPSAECEAKCSASCDAQCEAEVNVQCDVGCQAELQGGCEVECKGDGALFCDGQYVDHGGNLDECMDYLASLGIEVSGYAECSGNSCEAGCDAKCAHSPAPVSPASMLAALSGVAALVARRRSRRS